jgi:hypothetical protein
MFASQGRMRFRMQSAADFGFDGRKSIPRHLLGAFGPVPNFVT